MGLADSPNHQSLDTEGIHQGGEMERSTVVDTEFCPEYSEVTDLNQSDNLGTAWQRTDHGEVRRWQIISVSMIT